MPPSMPSPPWESQLDGDGVSAGSAWSPPPRGRPTRGRAGGDSASPPGSRRIQVCPERLSLVLGDQQLHQSGRIKVDPLGYEGSSSRISRNTSESCLPGRLRSAGGSGLPGFAAGAPL